MNQQHCIVLFVLLSLLFLVYYEISYTTVLLYLLSLCGYVFLNGLLILGFSGWVSEQTLQHNSSLSKENDRLKSEISELKKIQR
jgi:hypothetical protein